MTCEYNRYPLYQTKALNSKCKHTPYTVLPAARYTIIMSGSSIYVLNQLTNQPTNRIIKSTTQSYINQSTQSNHTTIIPTKHHHRPIQQYLISTR